MENLNNYLLLYLYIIHRFLPATKKYFISINHKLLTIKYKTIFPICKFIDLIFLYETIQEEMHNKK